MNVGVRELKARLSEYLGKVAAGEIVVVTDRGRPVARLVAIEAQSAVDRGIEEGWIEPARRNRLDRADRHRSPLSVSDALGEDRG
jgi:prevent-host-death family protein